MMQYAQVIARRLRTTVRVIPDAHRFLNAQHLPGKAIGPREVALVRDDDQRRILTCCGIPAHRIKTAASPITVVRSECIVPPCGTRRARRP
jgi:hypothetical protein